MHTAHICTIQDRTRIKMSSFFSFICLFIFAIESTQLEDPRQEWKSIQEQMLREYLSSAQDVLVAKKEIYDVKNRRLRLAEDEYNMLTAMAASRNSCKYNVFLRINWRSSK